MVLYSGHYELKLIVKQGLSGSAMFIRTAQPVRANEGTHTTRTLLLLLGAAAPVDVDPPPAAHTDNRRLPNSG